MLTKNHDNKKYKIVIYIKQTDNLEYNCERAETIYTWLFLVNTILMFVNFLEGSDLFGSDLLDYLLRLKINDLLGNLFGIQPS